MSADQKIGIFATNCTSGHTLQGWVRFCPFCGSAVIQPVSEAPSPAPSVVEVKAEYTTKPLLLRPNPKDTTAQPKVKDITVPPVAEPKAKGTTAPPVLEVKVKDPKVPPEAEAKVIDTPPPRPTSAWKYVVITGLLAAVACGVYFLSKSDARNTKALACQQLLTDATRLLSDGDFETALSKVRLGAVSCSDEQLSKANILKREIEKDAAACNRQVFSIQNLMNGKQPLRARTKLGEMSAACAKSPGGQSVAALVVQMPSEVPTPTQAGVVVVDDTPKVKANETYIPTLPTTPLAKPIKPEPGPSQELQPPSAGTAQVEQNILSKAATDMQGARLDSALARANTVLEMNPNNAEARRLKADIQRLQDKALREIKIE